MGGAHDRRGKSKLIVSDNIPAVLKTLRGTLYKQIPYAVSRALNDTAKDVQAELVRLLPRYLDRPTPFTEKAFAVRFSNKSHLVATIFIKPIQERYLRRQIEGGHGVTKIKPIDVKLNKYGNVPGLRGGRKVAQLLAKSNTFRAVINGTDGIWQRQKKGPLKLLLVMNAQIKHSPRFPFYKIGEQVAAQNIEANARKAVLNAIRTAR